MGKVVGRQHVRLLDIPREGRVRHQYVKAEAAVIGLARVLAQLAKPPPTVAIGVLPVVLLDRLVPLRPVERVQVQDVGFTIPRDQVQAARDSDALLVKVDGEHVIAHVVDAPRRFGLHGEEVAFFASHGPHDLPPDMEHAVYGETC